ncbi:MAG: tetratricopeptide repeat protein, partial [Myxococcota bacterium]
MANNVAALLRATGDYAESREVFLANIEIFRGAYGPDDRRVGQTLINLTIVELDLGLVDEAVAHAGEAVENLEAAHGPESMLVAKATLTRAQAELMADRPEDALRSVVEARALMAAQLGEAHSEVGIADSDLGNAYLGLERWAESAAAFQRSIETLEGAWGDEDPRLALVLLGLADARSGGGDDGGAHAALDRALRITGRTSEASVRVAKGKLLLKEGEAEAALVHLERALALREVDQGDPQMVVVAKFHLARALFATDTDPERARALARWVADHANEHELPEMAQRARALLDG